MRFRVSDHFVLTFGVHLAVHEEPLRAVCTTTIRRNAVLNYRLGYRFACPDIARARWRSAPAYFITMARLLCPVIAWTSSSEAPAAASCDAAVYRQPWIVNGRAPIWARRAPQVRQQIEI